MMFVKGNILKIKNKDIDAGVLLVLKEPEEIGMTVSRVKVYLFETKIVTFFSYNPYKPLKVYFYKCFGQMKKYQRGFYSNEYQLEPLV